MASAGVVRDRDRLPWLEPYRAPQQKSSGNRAGLATVGTVAVVALAGLLSVPLWRDAPQRTLEEPAPQTTVTLPAPADARPQVTVPTIEQPVEKVATAVDRRHAARPRRIKARSRRIVTADAEREAYRAIVSEQIAAALLEPAPPVIQPAPTAVQPAPAPPLRPAVNPRAKVAKGKTVQLGVYFTAREAEVAWRSAIRDYTYLVTMPKSIQRLRWRGKHYYRLQLGTPSKSHASQLCGHIRAIGRSCTVA